MRALARLGGPLASGAARPAALSPLLALALGGCLHRAPLVHFDAQTPVAVAVLLDQKEGTELDAAPPELWAAIDRELARRNLVVDRVPVDALAPLARNRNSRLRAELLAKTRPARQLFLLVELKAQFFGQFEGGYKWDIQGQLTVGTGEQLDQSSSAAVGIAAFLDQDSQGQREALMQTAAPVADRIGRLFDDHFAGHPDTTKVQAQRDPWPESWAARPIYFVLLDRFAPSEGAPRGPVDRHDPDFWHGGDFATLGRHLDELQKLGVGTVWLSPVSRCSERKKGPFGPSHCYWVEDLTEIEPRFGTFAELRALRDELHARGMRLVLDVVLNHVALDSPLFAAHPGWFHPRRALRDFSDPVQLEQGWLGGLPDLAQEQPEVARYLIDATRAWVERIQPDGLRLDAVKHVPGPFWLQLGRELHAAFPALRLIGEDLDFDPVRLGAAAQAGGFDAVFDFPLQGALVGALCGEGPVGAIGARLGLDRLSGGAAFVTLLDNHDLPRVASACHGDLERVALAVGVLAGLRGIPALTYGVEAGLAGEADPLNRADLEAEGLPALASGDHVAVVGAAPELGAWNPGRSVQLPERVALPANGAYELKLVIVRADGSVLWEPGLNEVVYVPAGEGLDTVALRWEPGVSERGI